MKTFKQYIREDDEKAETVDSLVNLIKKECPSFLDRVGRGGLLHRGANGLGSFEGRYELADGSDIEVYRKRVRKDRLPLSTDAQVSHALDEWFEENMGFRARSQAIFAFTEAGRGSADGYGGKKFVLFPVGKFSYAWSPDVDDLYNQISSELSARGKLAPAFTLPNGSTDKEKVDEYMRALKYTNNNIDKAMKISNEIMIDCDEVLLVRYYTVNQLKAIHKTFDIKYIPEYGDRDED